MGSTLPGYSLSALPHSRWRTLLKLTHQRDQLMCDVMPNSEESSLGTRLVTALFLCPVSEPDNNFAMKNLSTLKKPQKYKCYPFGVPRAVGKVVFITIVHDDKAAFLCGVFRQYFVVTFSQDELSHSWAKWNRCHHVCFTFWYTLIKRLRN